MKRRSLVIYLLSFNAILASIGVALLAMLLTSGGSASGQLVDCGGVYGAPTTSDDTSMPTNNSFDSVADAESFICHTIIYPTDPHGWLMEHISASRSRSAADVGRGLGFASVTLDYMRLNSDADLRIEVSPFHIDPIEYGIIDHVQIMGTDAKVIQGKDTSRVFLQWEANGYSFFTEAKLTDDFGLEDIYPILNSID
jgi:hypothetical protein